MAALANLVHQTSSSTGTGSFSLATIYGKQSFDAAFGTGGADVFWYFISNHDALEWEVGTGHLSDATTLVRDTVVDSTNAGSAVNFSAGVKDVTCDVPAENQAGAFYNVKSFGAKGDGSTNDHAAIQAAIDAAEASLFIKRVYLPDPAVAYVFNATVTIPAGVTVFGDNLKGLELSRCKPASGFTDPLFESDDYGNSRVLRIGLIGLYLDGSSTTLTAIQVNCQESVFRDLTIKNCFTYGLHLGGISSASDEQALNNQIKDNYLAGTIGTTEFFDGLFIDYFSADNTITGNYVEASKDAGIRSRGYNNKITNNHIYSVAGTGGGAGIGIYTETSADHDVSSNYVELTAAEAILMAGGGSDVGTLAGTIHGNVFRNIDTGNTSNGVIEISGSDVSALTVFGNVVRRDAATSYATAYFVYFNGITPTRAKVFGNEWQASLVTTAETNVTLPFAAGDLSIGNLTQTGYTDLAEISEPSSPAANVARRFAADDGNGVTTVGHKDSGGNVVPWSHFLQAGSGAVTRTQQAKLRERWDARDFGIVGDGSTDDTTAITNALAAVDDAGGGILEFPAGFNCRLTSTITNNYPDVLMRGAGADTFHDAGAIAAGTKFTWDGAASSSAAMVLITSPTGASNKVLSGGGIDGILLDCAANAGIGLQVNSRRQMLARDIFVLDATARCFDFLCGLTSTDYGEAADNQDCLFERLRWRAVDSAAVQSAHGMYIGGSSNANTSFNTFLHCVGQTYDGTGFVLEHADNNLFVGCRNFSTVGSGIDFDLFGPTAGGVVGARANAFVVCSWGAAAGSFTVRGTEAGFTAGTTDNILITEDTANSSAAPTLGTGCDIVRQQISAATAFATYTPTVTSATGTLGTHTINRARYMRVRGVVHVILDISITSAGTTPGGAVRVTLPITAANVAAAGIVNGYEFTNGNPLAGYVDGTNARANMFLATGAFPGSNGNRLMVALNYEAA